MNGKTVLITGASTGIGLQSAIGLAKLGAEVVMVGRDERRTAQAAALDAFAFQCKKVLS